MLKTIALLTIAGVAGYVGYQYYKQQKAGKCACEEETTSTPATVAAPTVAMEAPEQALQTYAASPRDTLSTPSRLLINTAWPGGDVQGIAKL